MPSLYSDELLDHYRNPRNYGRLSAPDISYEDLNPLCGDRIRIELSLKDNIVEEARFQGDGCAISLAAASMLTELIIGADIRSTEIISEETLLSALKSDIHSSRMKCVQLPLEVLRSGVGVYKKRVQHE
jgi:nitrogen fixation NifU-like protein